MISKYPTQHNSSIKSCPLPSFTRRLYSSCNVIHDHLNHGVLSLERTVLDLSAKSKARHLVIILQAISVVPSRLVPTVVYLLRFSLPSLPISCSSPFPPYFPVLSPSLFSDLSQLKSYRHSQQYPRIGALLRQTLWHIVITAI